MTIVDIAIVAVYLFGITLFGLQVGRSDHSSEAFFRASRSTTWPVIGLTLLASNISSTALVGLAGAAYSTGISAYNYEWMAAVVLVFFCIFFLPFLLQSGVYTLPEFLERRFGRFSRSAFAIITLFLNITLNAASALYCGALLFKVLLPDTPIWQIVIAEALSAAIYTIAGGLRSVIFTEVIQAFLLLVASTTIAAMSFAKVGGWDVVRQGVDPVKLSLLRPLSDPVMPWLGLVTGVPLLGFYYWCTNQTMVQRVLSAKDVNHGRWGSLLAGALKLPTLFLMVLPGSAAILLYRDLPNGDMVYSRLVFDLLPPGLVGLTISGFLSALMSSVASTLNASSTLLTMDFFRRRHPDLDGPSLVRISRVSTLLFTLLAAAWAPQIERFGSLWQFVQGMLAYVVTPVTALYLVGLFWKRANTMGANSALIAGLLAGAALFFAGPVGGRIDLQFLYVAPVLFVFSAVILVAVSLATPPDPAEKTEGLIWSPAYYRAETETLAAQPLWRNYRALGILLLLVTGSIVAVFR